MLGAGGEEVSKLTEMLGREAMVVGGSRMAGEFQLTWGLGRLGEEEEGGICSWSFTTCWT